MTASAAGGPAAGGSVGRLLSAWRRDARVAGGMLRSRGFAWALLGILGTAYGAEVGSAWALQRGSARYFHPYIGELYWPGQARERRTPEGERFVWRTNALGFRGPDLPAERAPGERRVFFFGGSAMACGHYPEEATWTHLSAGEASARDAGRPWTYQNCARDGMTSFQSLNLYLHVVARDLAPDVVCVQHAYNDLVASRCGSYGLPFGHVGKGETLLSRRSAFVLMAEQIMLFARVRARGGVGAGDRAVPQGVSGAGADGAVRDYADRMAVWAGEARRRGTTLVLLTEPYARPEPGAGDALSEGMAQMADRTRLLGGELGVPVVDLQAILGGDPGLFLDGLHLNAEGMRRAAEALGAALPGIAEAGGSR